MVRRGQHLWLLTLCYSAMQCGLHAHSNLPSLVVAPCPHSLPALPHLTQARSNTPASPSCVATDSVLRALTSACDARSLAGESGGIRGVWESEGKGCLLLIWVLTEPTHLRAVPPARFYAFLHRPADRKECPVCRARMHSHRDAQPVSNGRRTASGWQCCLHWAFSNHSAAFTAV